MLVLLRVWRCVCCGVWNASWNVNLVSMWNGVRALVLGCFGAGGG